jgi:hypothetical protein
MVCAGNDQSDEKNFSVELINPDIFIQKNYSKPINKWFFYFKKRKIKQEFV